MSERIALDAVLLDAGGTLVRLDFEWMADMLRGLGHVVEPQALRRAEVAGRRHYDASAGRAPAPGAAHPALGSAGDIREYFAGTLAAAGVDASLIPPATAALHARQAETIGLWARPMEGARETLAALRRLRLRVAVVSNSDGRAEAHLENADVRDGIEFVVDSQRVGIEKPDPEIFRIALRRLGTPAARTLYVGDILSVDAAGAGAAGMPFTIIDPYGDYVPPGTSRIPSIGALPEWIRTHAETPAPPAATAGTDSSAEGPGVVAARNLETRHLSTEERP